MSKDALISELQRKIKNLTRMNQILRKFSTVIGEEGTKQGTEGGCSTKAALKDASLYPLGREYWDAPCWCIVG